MKHVGTLVLGNKVDITDPCYDKDVWCRMTVDCEPGEYKGYVELSDEGEWGIRVKSISIFKCDKICGIEEMELIGEICVDVGMAGFFNNKPDFNNEEWEYFCDKTHHGNAWNMYNGIFSYSGYGDGSYDVYANEERSAFTIVFIEEEPVKDTDDEPKSLYVDDLERVFVEMVQANNMNPTDILMLYKNFCSSKPENTERKIVADAISALFLGR